MEITKTLLINAACLLIPPVYHYDCLSNLLDNDNDLVFFCFAAKIIK